MQSLKPNQNLIFALLKGDPRALAIVESWKFKFPVTFMSSEALQKLSEKCRTEFNGGREYDFKCPSVEDSDALIDLVEELESGKHEKL